MLQQDSGAIASQSCCVTAAHGVVCPEPRAWHHETVVHACFVLSTSDAKRVGTTGAARGYTRDAANVDRRAIDDRGGLDAFRRLK